MLSHYASHQLTSLTYEASASYFVGKGASPAKTMTTISTLANNYNYTFATDENVVHEEMIGAGGYGEVHRVLPNDLFFAATLIAIPDDAKRDV